MANEYIHIVNNFYFITCRTFHKFFSNLDVITRSLLCFTILLLISILSYILKKINTTCLLMYAGKSIETTTYHPSAAIPTQYTWNNVVVTYDIDNIPDKTAQRLFKCTYEKYGSALQSVNIASDAEGHAGEYQITMTMANCNTKTEILKDY